MTELSSIWRVALGTSASVCDAPSPKRRVIHRRQREPAIPSTANAADAIGRPPCKPIHTTNAIAMACSGTLVAEFLSTMPMSSRVTVASQITVCSGPPSWAS